MTPISDDFARAVAESRNRPLSAAADAEVRQLLQDYLGVALRGSTTPAARIVARYQAQFASSPAEATVLGHGTKVSATGAAFANAVAAHSLEMDDTDARSMLHLSAPVVSTALACAEVAASSGANFVNAVAIGCRVMQAVSDAVNPGMRNRGFHSTAVCGVFGATAAAGYLLGLDKAQLTSAFGAAGAHAAGLFEIYGPTMQKSLHPGPAAQNGIVAARLALLGFEGAPTIFDGRFGLFKAFTDEANPDAARARLAAGEALGIEYKPYSSFRPIHSAVDCALEVRKTIGADTAQIVGLKLVRHPMWAGYHIIPAPATEQEAKGSVNYGIAVALACGDAQLEQYEPHVIADPIVRRLAGLLTTDVDPSLERGDSCRLRAELADGRIIERHADYPLGSTMRPLSAAGHEAKFRYLTRPLLSDERAALVLQRAAAIGEAASVHALIEATQPDRVAGSPTE